MDRRGFIQLTGLTALATAACGSDELLRTPPARRPNILLLMTDQHRGDCLGCDGNSVIKTPNLDALARDGYHFTSAYSSTPSCTPARAALLTGLQPWNHGMLGYSKVADRYSPEFPRTFSENGYRTHAIGKLHYHPQRNYHGFQSAEIDESGRVEAPGFVSDYRKWFREVAPELDPDRTGIGWNDYPSAAYALPEELHPTRWTADRAVEFLEKVDGDKPFLLKVSFARPHSPYDPPRRFMEAYSDADMPAPQVGAWAAEKYATRSSDRDDIWHGDLGAEQAKASRRGYYGSVSFVDEQIGRILAALDSQSLRENTLVLFLADHGDMLGDNNLWRKTYAYEPSARIPMIMRLPGGRREGGQTKKIARPVEIRDIFPTMLDAAGISVRKKLDGASLIRLAKQDGEWRKHIDLEHDVCYDVTNHWSAITDGRWKYIFHALDASEQLFDLKQDPYETQDLSGSARHKGELERQRHLLTEHLKPRGQEWVKNGALVARPKRLLHSPNYPGTAV